MKRLLPLLLGAQTLLTLSSPASELALTLMPPAAAVPAGTPVPVDLVAMNPGTLDVPFDAPATLVGEIDTGRDRQAVTLEATALAPRSVAPGAFAVRRYRVTLPSGTEGRVVLAVQAPQGPRVHAVLQMDAAAPGATQAAAVATTQLDELGATAPVAASLARTFAGRFMPNQPIYFLYGEADQAAKFQFSFDYRLATLRWGDRTEPKTSTLRLGYTQRSVWDIDASSSPFYDTSYMPEVAVVTDWALPREGMSGFTWMGTRAGYQHESNGKDGDDSRSLNRLYFRSRFVFGTFDSWYLVVLPELHAYVGGLSNNPRLKDFRGYGNLQMYVSYQSGITLRANSWAGEDFDHFSYQLDLTYPLQLRWLGLESYLQAQYFNGYGESLRNYDRKSDALRFGFSLVR